MDNQTAACENGTREVVQETEILPVKGSGPRRDANMPELLDDEARAALIAARGERSQAEIAAAAGISQAMLNHIESGKKQPGAELLVRLCKVLRLRRDTKVVSVEVVKLVPYGQ